MQDSQQIFKLHSEYQPTGDQPQAIEKLVKGFKEGNQFETSTTADCTTLSHPDTARRFIHRTAPINIFIFFILFPSFPFGIKKGTLFL